MNVLKMLGSIALVTFTLGCFAFYVLVTQFPCLGIAPGTLGCP